jgi:hypothetical protein
MLGLLWVVLWARLGMGLCSVGWLVGGLIVGVCWACGLDIFAHKGGYRW